MADLIERKAAIKAIENLQDCYNGFSDTYDKACIIGVLEEVPSAQPTQKNESNTLDALDCVSRQAAIDAEEKLIKDCNPDHFVGHQKFIEYMDNAEIGSFGNWQFANGFNMGLTAAEVAIKNLPSAQSEWNNHEVACLLAELFDDDCACNFNGIDEWLPLKCDFAETCCPYPVGVACWEQYLKHRAERRTNE